MFKTLCRILSIFALVSLSTESFGSDVAFPNPQAPLPNTVNSDALAWLSTALIAKDAEFGKPAKGPWGLPLALPVLDSVQIIRVIDVKALEPDRNAIPWIIRSDVQTFVNCGKEKQSNKITFKFTINNGFVSSITEGWKTGGSNSSKFSLGFKTENFSAGVEESNTVTFENTEAKTNTTNSSVGSEVTIESPFIFSAESTTDVSISFRQYMYDLPFEAKLILDGKVNEVRAINNNRKWNSSDFLSEFERTATLRGVVQVYSASKRETRLKARTPTLEECSAENPTSYVKKNRPTISPVMLNAITNIRNVRIFGGNAGDICYIGPCDQPLNGTREECLLEEKEGSGIGPVEYSCSNCGSKTNSQCDAPVEDGKFIDSAKLIGPQIERIQKQRKKISLIQTRK